MPKRGRRSANPDVRAIGDSLRRIVDTLVRALEIALESNVQGGPARASQPVAAESGVRRLRISPARRAALKLQGQYMGKIHSLKPAQKARVKALRARQGLAPALRLAERLSRG